MKKDRGKAWPPRGQEPYHLPPWGVQGHMGAIPKQDTAAPVRQPVAKAVLAGIIHPLASPEDGPLFSCGSLHGWAQKKGELMGVLVGPGWRGSDAQEISRNVQKRENQLLPCGWSTGTWGSPTASGNE